MRFYAAEVDAPSLPPILNEAKAPMEVSLAHDFTRRKDIKLRVPEYQLVVDLVSNTWLFMRRSEQQHTVERSKITRRSCRKQSISVFEAQLKWECRQNV